MIETLTHEDGSVIDISTTALRVQIGACSSLAPTSERLSLTLAETEHLIKVLGTAAAQIRGASARAAI